MLPDYKRVHVVDHLSAAKTLANDDRFLRYLIEIAIGEAQGLKEPEPAVRDPAIDDLKRLLLADGNVSARRHNGSVS